MTIINDDSLADFGAISYPFRRLASSLFTHVTSSQKSTDRLGYTQCSKDPCLFFKRNTDGTLNELILVYVDDFLFLGTSTSYETFLKLMREEYELSTSPSDKLVVWNGLEIERRGTTIHVTQVIKVRESSLLYCFSSVWLVIQRHRIRNLPQKTFSNQLMRLQWRMQQKKI